MGSEKDEQENLLESVGEELNSHLEEERREKEKEIEELKRGWRRRKKRQRSIMIVY